MSIAHRLEELLDRWEELRENGKDAAPEELCQDCPKTREELRKRIDRLKRMDWLEDSTSSGMVGVAEVKSGTTPERLNDRYRLERKIAEGGFGEVWQTYDEQLNRRVALKLTRIDCFEEARRVAKLRHPGIVSVHDVGRENEYCYIVFDLIDGSDLARRITEARPEPIPAALLVAEIAERLQHAHEQGFIHRDIKPANILLDTEGAPFLTDFGIAATEAELAIKDASSNPGTLCYMAPEQLNGETADVRSDLYSLGVVFYEMLTGRLPFVAATPGKLRERVLNEAPTPPRQVEPRVPESLERICLKLLSKKPDHRFGSAKEVARLLRDVVATLPSPSEGRPLPWVFGVGIAMAFGALAVYLILG